MDKHPNSHLVSLKELFKKIILYRNRSESFWDHSVNKVRKAGGSSRDVSMPPGVLFFENLYLWERAVMEPISGRFQDVPVDWFFRTFVKEKVDRALSISCGTGYWERRMSQMGFASRIEAFDSSPACLDWARDLAARESLDNIDYRREDINTLALPPEAYDVVISVAALHHVEKLEHVLDSINRSLKPAGLFFYDEYIGPNRMQWPDDLLEIVNGILQIIPERYRKQVSDESIKVREDRVPVEKMIATDPTEAIRSEEIIPLTEQYFEVLEKREYGGALLMPLFMNIAGNFDAQREEDRIIMDFCIYLENLLLEQKIIAPNGVVVVCRKKD